VFLLRGTSWIFVSHTNNFHASDNAERAAK